MFKKLALSTLALALLAGCGTNPYSGIQATGMTSASAASKSSKVPNMISATIVLVDRGTDHSNLYFSSDYKQGVRVETGTEIIDYTHQLSHSTSSTPDVFPYQNLVGKELIKGQQVTIEVEKYTDTTDSSIAWRAKSVTIR